MECHYVRWSESWRYIQVQVRDRLETKLKEKNYLNSGTMRKYIIRLVGVISMSG